MHINGVFWKQYTQRIVSLPVDATGYEWKTYHGECNGLEKNTLLVELSWNGQTSTTFFGPSVSEGCFYNSTWRPFDVERLVRMVFNRTSVDSLDGQQTDVCRASGRWKKSVPFCDGWADRISIHSFAISLLFLLQNHNRFLLKRKHWKGRELCDLDQIWAELSKAKQS